MNTKDIEALSNRTKPSTHVLLDIESAHLSPGIVNGTYFLTVIGTKPWITMTVVFSPLYYIRQPEYWGIEVVGIQKGFGLPTVGPFSHTEEITSFLGVKGVEVIGENQTIKLDL